MFFFFLNSRYDKIKQEYMRKKLEGNGDAKSLESEFLYLTQFFEPSVELRVCPENYLMAQTQIKHQNNPQPDFIQVCVGVLLEDKSNFEDLKNQAAGMIEKELISQYPQIFN